MRVLELETKLVNIFDVLITCSNLQCLKLYAHNLTNIDLIDKLSMLQILHLYYPTTNNINLAPLKNLLNLYTLYLNVSALTNQPNIHVMQRLKLQHLYLYVKPLYITYDYMSTTSVNLNVLMYFPQYMKIHVQDNVNIYTWNKKPANLYFDANQFIALTYYNNKFYETTNWNDNIE